MWLGGVEGQESSEVEEGSRRRRRGERADRGGLGPTWLALKMQQRGQEPTGAGASEATKGGKTDSSLGSPPVLQRGTPGHSTSLVADAACFTLLASRTMR